MILIADVSILLLMMIKDCCLSAFRSCVVWLSRFPLPLLDFVSVAVVLVALGGKDVMVTNILIEDMSMLLMLIEDC